MQSLFQSGTHQYQNKKISDFLRSVIITESTAGTGTYLYVDDMTELHGLREIEAKITA